MEWLATAFFQLFSLLAIILPILGGILLLWYLWRMTKALENIRQELSHFRLMLEKWPQSQQMVVGEEGNSQHKEKEKIQTQLD